MTRLRTVKKNIFLGTEIDFFWNSYDSLLSNLVLACDCLIQLDMAQNHFQPTHTNFELKPI